MPARIKKKNSLSIDEICSKICQIFDQAQHSATSHKKNVVELYKCHAEMASMKFSEANQLSGETKFLEIVNELLSRIFLLKRTEKSAENIVKLLGAYVKLINERAVEELRGREEDPVDDDYGNVKDEDTLASRFTFGFCRFLLAGFRAKDKNVRFRVVQTRSAVVSHLGEIDEGLWKSIWKHLEDRLQDKDAAVRTQAALGLCKFAGGEDPDSEDIQVTLTLRNALSTDDSAEVRRAILWNIPINDNTIDAILDRLQDCDISVRKNCYIFLKRNATQNNEMGPTHPRRITIAQRERIVCTGIGDREDSVVDAARDLIATWFDLAEEMPVKQEGPDKDEHASSNAKFLAFLSLFDLLVAPESAEKALLSVFETKPSETKLLTSHQMTPESAFLARVYIESLKRFKNEEDKMKKLDRLENYLPLVTDHLFPLQETFNDCFLYEYRNEEHRDVKEFFLEEMLKITTHLDYGDETGRRKTYDLIKAMLKENIPENILTGCMQVLPFITASERDLIRVVVEFIQDLRDPGDDIDVIAQEAEGDPDASFESTPSTPVRPNTQKSVQEKSTEDKAPINLKCLTMSVAMLEQVNDTINNNSSLNGLFKELILPTVKEPFDDISRDKAWTCLALICLIDQKLATMKTVEMFLQHSTTAPEELKIIILQGLFDILMVYQRAILSPENVRAVADSLIAKLEEETSAKAQEVICHGLAKLIMAGIFTDKLIIVHLLMVYFSPETISNQPLRQLLLHFFNLYSASSPANKRLVAEVFTDTLQELSNARNDTSTEAMVSPTLIIGHFVTWTNPYNFRVNQETVITEEHPLYCDAASIQFMMTIDMVKILLKDTLDKDDKKALCTNISKLHIPDNADGNALRTLKMLLFRLQSRQPVKDATARNAINKFEIALSKKFESQLANFSEEEYRDLDELKELFTFLDELIPLDDEDEVIDVKPKRTRKRRSDSVTSLSSEDTETNSRKPKNKVKKRRISSSDDGSDFETERTEHTAPPATRTRSNPKRAAAPKDAVFIDLTLDSDDETRSTPVPSKSTTSVKVETASVVDADINHLLEEEIEEMDTSLVVDDSLLGPADSDSEGEEDEVNDLLADDED